MAFIYKIINDINNKIYIGKTQLTIEERWREHKQDYQKLHTKSRPLYRAMNKYGIEHFHIEQVEEVQDTSLLCDRETYWIEFYRSFKYGYNATIGGDGKPYLDYDLIIATYEQVHNIKETARITGACRDSVCHILHNAKIPIKSSESIAYETQGKPISCYKNDTLIKTFGSQGEAARWIIENNYSSSTIVKGIMSSISKAARNIVKTAFGFTWHYI